MKLLTENKSFDFETREETADIIAVTKLMTFFQQIFTLRLPSMTDAFRDTTCKFKTHIYLPTSVCLQTNEAPLNIQNIYSHFL